MTGTASPDVIDLIHVTYGSDHATLTVAVRERGGGFRDFGPVAAKGAFRLLGRDLRAAYPEDFAHDEAAALLLAHVHACNLRRGQNLAGQEYPLRLPEEVAEHSGAPPAETPAPDAPKPWRRADMGDGVPPIPDAPLLFADGADMGRHVRSASTHFAFRRMPRLSLTLEVPANPGELVAPYPGEFVEFGGLLYRVLAEEWSPSAPHGLPGGHEFVCRLELEPAALDGEPGPPEVTLAGATVPVLAFEAAADVDNLGGRTITGELTTAPVPGLVRALLDGEPLSIGGAAWRIMSADAGGVEVMRLSVARMASGGEG